MAWQKTGEDVFIGLTVKLHQLLIIMSRLAIPAANNLSVHTEHETAARWDTITDNRIIFNV